MTKTQSLLHKTDARDACRCRKRIQQAFSVLLISVCTAWYGFSQGALPESSTAVKYQIWSVIIRADGVSLYAAPSETAKVLHQFRKGHDITFKTNVDAPPPWEGKQWIYYPLEGRKREGTNVPAGWLHRGDIFIPTDFKKVTIWPIRYLIHDAEFYQFVYKFNPDGTGVVTHYSDEHPQGEFLGPMRVLMVEGIAVDGNANESKKARQTIGTVLGIYDEKTKCVYGVYHREPNCDKYRDPRYGGDLAQALFSEPSKPVFFWDRCVVDCEGVSSKKDASKR